MREKAHTPALLRRINRQLLRVQKCYEAVKKLPSKYQELRPWPAALFEREYDAALYAGDLAARRGLQRVRKRWIAANEEGLKAGNARKLETLNMLRDKVKKAAWQLKGGASAGYWEALQSGDRALSDEVWQGRLTAREIHLHLVDAGVFSRSATKERRQLHEIRRIGRKLGIRLAEGQRGRKRKPYLPKQPKIEGSAHTRLAHVRGDPDAVLGIVDHLRCSPARLDQCLPSGFALPAL